MGVSKRSRVAPDYSLHGLGRCSTRAAKYTEIVMETTVAVRNNAIHRRGISLHYRVREDNTVPKISLIHQLLES